MVVRIVTAPLFYFWSLYAQFGRDTPVFGGV